MDFQTVSKNVLVAIAGGVFAFSAFAQWQWVDKEGSKVFSDRDNYVLDNPEPIFNKHFDFETIFPGCPLL